MNPIDLYWNKFVITRETYLFCASSSNFADMLTMVRGWTLLTLEATCQRWSLWWASDDWQMWGARGCYALRCYILYLSSFQPFKCDHDLPLSLSNFLSLLNAIITYRYLWVVFRPCTTRCRLQALPQPWLTAWRYFPSSASCPRSPPQNEERTWLSWPCWLHVGRTSGLLPWHPSWEVLTSSVPGGNFLRSRPFLTTPWRIFIFGSFRFDKSYVPLHDTVVLYIVTLHYVHRLWKMFDKERCWNERNY